ncbi:MULTISPECIES: (2Fe-2S) ferredoxin domain-containing protein [Proteiniphilum]|jgi:NADP-reducing hydrogenase subunit HndB|uniref:(2Fe-2S) ferredoxin domain-containing protein n=1 Tax=Proteiniphilum TaxID=294702 RepID=UPI00039D20D5|nr:MULTISPECIES: (2Fe-2S) ferredoxin domain-containing protein [Proteiniphilum]MDY9917579.1 (2Fe-2S) ferredoxin domain-containing protein [Proteiniphilum sp.]SEA10769.1 NAD(P)-dependent iron-only hydrogenase iron-sulfur protein [Porphyromonadaceae bacterium KH3R12]SFL36035.1 NAD(P)-dependent iron-only hydrogenase iron-sulfur protein [Porphyromonadaceae bacterium KH3CP3RA]SFS33003.1 NAD(P)-dependent iron-only hydrogenase iron-sulfur protein [Porphyromonadaceae bacterium NLAE-zl-C104]
MTEIRTLADLKRRQEEVMSRMRLRDRAEDPDSLVQVKVAMATCGIASGAKEVMEFFVEELDKRKIDAVVTQTGCMGYCFAEPTVEVTLPGREAMVFGYVDTRKADEIIERYIKEGELVDGIIPQNYNTI